MSEVRSRSLRAENNWSTICCSAFSCMQIFWTRLVLQKWFNVSSIESDYNADFDDDYEDRANNVVTQEFDLRSSGVTKDECLKTDDGFKLRRRNSETFRVQYMETKAIRSLLFSAHCCVFAFVCCVFLFSFDVILLSICFNKFSCWLTPHVVSPLLCGFDVARICAGTWNVGGIVPPADLDIDGWLDTVEPADIYVLGFQEVVPLDAGTIFGMEDGQPATEWENIIREALNRLRPRKVKIVSHSDPSSPSKFKQSQEVSCSVEDMFVETSLDACNAVSSMDKKPNTVENTEKPIVSQDSVTNTDGLCSTNDNPSCLPIQEYLQRQFSTPRTRDSRREERFSYGERVGLSWPEPPLRLLNQYVLERSDSSKSVNLSIKNLRKPSYVRIVSKQMVGVFLTIWVRRSLRKHISNLCVSTVGVGIMGYIGNKGSVSVSMSIYQTPFCFVCTHLSAGEKDTNYQKRNEDVREIHRQTQFCPQSLNADELPRSIRDHERVIWLGDLNYRIDLSYEKTHELIARQEWQMLLEHDQLSREMTKGNVFEGWSEGTLDFPPTYKYEMNSENYIGDVPESGKRRPAWCDRILWNGKGMKLFSYRRNEIKLSDHRPVTATFLAKVEVLSAQKLQRALALTYAEIKGPEAFADVFSPVPVCVE